MLGGMPELRAGVEWGREGVQGLAWELGWFGEWLLGGGMGLLFSLCSGGDLYLTSNPILLALATVLRWILLDLL